MSEQRDDKHGVVALRTWTDSGGTLRCGECCNGDRCDDATHFRTDGCPHCKGTGRAIWLAVSSIAPQTVGIITAEPITTREELEAAYQQAIRGRHISEIAPVLALRNKALDSFFAVSATQENPKYEIVFKQGQHHIYLKNFAVRIATFAPGIGEPDMKAVLGLTPQSATVPKVRVTHSHYSPTTQGERFDLYLGETFLGQFGPEVTPLANAIGKALGQYVTSDDTTKEGT